MGLTSRGRFPVLCVVGWNAYIACCVWFLPVALSVLAVLQIVSALCVWLTRCRQLSCCDAGVSEVCVFVLVCVSVLSGVLCVFCVLCFVRHHVCLSLVL